MGRSARKKDGDASERGQERKGKLRARKTLPCVCTAPGTTPDTLLRSFAANCRCRCKGALGKSNSRVLSL